MNWVKKLVSVSVVVLGMLGWAESGSAANESSPHAEAGSIQLRNFVKKVHRAQGRFVQQTSTADGQRQPKQEGYFAFNREKGQFLWRVEHPYEQLVLADGQRFIQYDPDLSQATERGIEDTVGRSPAALLFGSRRIDQAFDIQDESDVPFDEAMASQLSWLRAYPKEGEAGFEYIAMGFKDGLPEQLIIIDGFGQRTTIQLLEMQPDAPLAADTFQFEPPAGVDYVRLQ